MSSERPSASACEAGRQPGRGIAGGKRAFARRCPSQAPSTEGAEGRLNDHA
jgi:hypothetical protein